MTDIDPLNLAQSPDLIAGESTRMKAQRLLDAEKEREKFATAYRFVFASSEGQIVLADLAREGCLLETTATDGATNTTHLNEGRRMMVVHILQRLSWSVGELQELAARKVASEIQQSGGEHV